MKYTHFIYYTSITKYTLNQLHSHYSFFNYNSKYDLYRYNSKKRKQYKKLVNYQYYVNDHHIIPKQFRDHKLIQNINFDISSSRNIKIMPTLQGIQYFNLDDNVLTHYKGHLKYNKFVKDELNEILLLKDIDEQRYNFILFFWFLELNLDFKGTIPWN